MKNRKFNSILKKDFLKNFSQIVIKRDVMNPNKEITVYINILH